MGFRMRSPFMKRIIDMIKKIKNCVHDGITLIFGTLFALVAAPIIHLSGLDNVDSCPTPEKIEKANKLAADLKREREQ